MGEVWFFYKYLEGTATISEQERAAKNLAESDHWIGAHPSATKQRYRHVSSVLQHDDDPSSKNRPVKRGDTLWVYNIFVLGSTRERIIQTLDEFHEAGVNLNIYTVGYSDDGANSHYRVVRGILHELQFKSELVHTRKKKKQRPGRPKRGVTFFNITPRGRYVIVHYAIGDKEFTQSSALNAIRNEATDGKGPIGKKTFLRLVDWYREKRENKKFRKMYEG